METSEKIFESAFPCEGVVHYAECASGIGISEVSLKFYLAVNTLHRRQKDATIFHERSDVVEQVVLYLNGMPVAKHN